MKLELKHLAPYLPYELECEKSDGKVSVIKTATLSEVDYYFRNKSYNLKPILRNLSDLTKEIEHNGEKFVPEDKLKLNENELHSLLVITYPISIIYWKVEKLFKWHFDVWGLIKEGLAIDINSIK